MAFSDELKVFWYTPARTASRSCAPIIEHLKFTITEPHSFFSKPEHYNYHVICNVRNPYTRLYSLFVLMKEHFKRHFVFRDWLRFHINRKDVLMGAGQNLYPYKYFTDNMILPQTLIRFEKLQEDISNLFLIKNSYDKDLENVLQNNIFVNNYKSVEINSFPWHEFYDKNITDPISSNFEKEFELFGYDLDCWKDGKP